MKHRIRINGKIKEFDGQLGSGLFDKNGKEIFAGDNLRFYRNQKIVTGRVYFDRGAFTVSAKVDAFKAVARPLELCAPCEIISEQCTRS